MPAAPTHRVRAFIALGANLGDRAATIARALSLIEALPETRVIARSSLVETQAVTLSDSPPQPAYLNAAAELSTGLAPRILLESLFDIEQRLGRDRAGEARWAARTIDLDLLFYADAVIDEPGLIVPHPRLHERLFVLGPLAEIAPGFRHPVLGKTVGEMAGAISRPSGPRP